MGCKNSKESILDNTSGDGKAFLEKYDVGKVVGQGEFGVVKVVHYSDSSAEPTDDNGLACKILRKGRVFKNNTLYAPIHPHVLRLECDILATLRGKHHTLKIQDIFESPSVIYIVSEFCNGGEMMSYVSSVYGEEGLRTEDVSRIAFQLFDAVNHCANHNVIHRDIKPENVMFTKTKKGASLRLIDFGSGTIDDGKDRMMTPSSTHSIDESGHTDRTSEQADGTILRRHTTFAGSAFYISPEMFKKNYTCKTDVWSAGVTMYVLVSGYPYEALQRAFNVLQNSKSSSELRGQELKEKLVNMPQDMPESFYEMLEWSLIYKHRMRKDAKDILNSEFIGLHRKQASDLMKLGISMHLKNVGSRHDAGLEYAKYERSVTTVLASMLNKADLKTLVRAIDKFIDDEHKIDEDVKTPAEYELFANSKNLQVIAMQDLISVMLALNFDETVETIKNIPSKVSYEEYAYHVALVRQFITYEDLEADESQSRSRVTRLVESQDNSTTRKWNSFKTQSRRADEIPMDDGLDSSGTSANRNSVHGGRVWDHLKKRLNKENGGNFPRSISSPDLKLEQ